MKKIVLLIAALVCTAFVSAADNKETPQERPKIPEQVTLVNGAVLRKISIVRWEKDRVVLKHAGGIDSVRYDLLSAQDRTVFMLNRDRGIEQSRVEAELRAAQAKLDGIKAEAEYALKERIRKAISDKSLVVGMTKEEARESWGPPDRANVSDGENGSFSQWIYEDRNFRPSRDTYVYFRNGKLTSWQTDH